MIRRVVAALLILSGPPAQAAQPVLSAHDLALLNRLTWGASPSDAAAMAALGRRRWLERQLHPSADDAFPLRAQAELDRLGLSDEPLAAVMGRLEAQRRAADLLNDPNQRKAAQRAHALAEIDLARRAAARSLLRDLYSPHQVQEQLTWFWFNHFNVDQNKDDIRALVGDYENRAIRPNALGNFRVLLEATLKHPAMLRYLDNDQNSAGHINENYARELLELHTMGVGSGYTQEDVQELARVLSGVGINLSPYSPKLKPGYQRFYVREGVFEFNPNRHDFGDKIVLGHVIKGSGFPEVEQAIDILVRQPATAHHLSLQLATYFIGDHPPRAVVDRMAAAFRRSDGDIAATLRPLLASREFEDSLGNGFKDPMHYVVSAVRMAYGDKVILNTEPMRKWLNRLGEGLYDHHTPDGYSMNSAAWSGPGELALRFEIARQIGSGSAGLFTFPGVFSGEPAFPQAQNALYYSTVSWTLGPVTQTTLKSASSAEEWNVLFLSSPEFMRR